MRNLRDERVCIVIETVVVHRHDKIACRLSRRKVRPNQGHAKSGCGSGRRSVTAQIVVDDPTNGLIQDSTERHGLKDAGVCSEIGQWRKCSIRRERAAEEDKPAEEVVDGARVAHRNVGGPIRRVPAEDKHAFSHVCHQTPFDNPRRSLRGDAIRCVD